MQIWTCVYVVGKRNRAWRLIANAFLFMLLLIKSISSSSCTRKTNIHFRFVWECVRFKYAYFIAVSNCLSRCLGHCFCSFRSLFVSIDYTTLELNYFVFEKHVIAHTSNTNIPLFFVCASSMLSFIAVSNRFRSLFLLVILF